MKKLIVLFALFSSFAFAQNFNYKSYEVLLKKYVSDKGNVNYDELNRNKAELNVVVAQFEKNSVKKNWSKNEKMAYYINTYNVYTLKSIIDNYPVKSIKDIKDVWDKKIIPMGAEKVSLSYVENKILRKMGDPRIHFAINCASFSCPNLSNNAYEPENLNKQLEQVAKEFINDKTKNSITETALNVSEIFKWFAEDFSKNGTVVDFLNKYASIKINEKVVLNYKDYNWSLNK